jgi:hypothetical protein
MVSGTHITAMFDTTNLTNVFPFDQGTGQPNGSNPLNAGDGHNQLEEFQFIPPIPAGYSCPQTTFDPSPVIGADPGASPADGEC